MTRPLVLAAALALAAAAPGCFYLGARTHIGPRLEPEVVAAIVPGSTTRSEVLALLGPPNEYKRAELAGALVDDRLRLSGVLALARRAEDVYTWQHDRIAVDGTALLLLNVFDVDTESELLVVFFDADGVVLHVAFTPSGDDAAAGGEPPGP